MRPESKRVVAVAGLALGAGLAYLLRSAPAPHRESVAHEVAEPSPPEAPAELGPPDEPVRAAPELAAPPVRASAAPPAGSVTPPESEEAFLRELQRLHLTDKAKALALAKKGDEWYSGTGPFAEARKAMAVTLLVDLGNMDEARALTRRFIEAYPESAYRPLVQGVTGIHPRPGKPEGLE